MRVSIGRLRVGLLVGAGLLVVVIAAFLGYAHLRAHRLLRDLPGRLGADITRESNGFTYSQSLKGKTVYTIHAAKVVQRRDGKTTLHDVGIVLYGQKADRADRIYGSEFEYDQKAGVVRATGVVHLDLQAPAPVDARGRAEYAAGGEPGAARHEGAGAGDGGNERMVHVTTSDLVFVQSLGAASTDKEIEFKYGGMNGRAKGASFHSETGMTVLQSEVRVSGLRDGQPVMLTASHAEMDRGTGELRLMQARYVAVGEGAASEGRAAKERERTLLAEEAEVHLRGDGSVERVLASGGVSLQEAGGVLRGRSAEVRVSAGSRPEVARVFGGLTWMEDGPLRQVEGRAGQGVARFDGAGRLVRAVMTEGATLRVRERSAPAAPPSERTVSGDAIELGFQTADGGRQWVHDGRALGSARMLLVDRGVAGAAERTTELRGDTLTAQTVWDGRSARLSRVDGAGHTALRRSDGVGGEDTSAGEALEVSFGAGGAGGATAGGGGAGRGLGAKEQGAKELGGGGGAGAVTRAVQRGGVVLTHLPGRGAGAPGAASGSGLEGPVRATAGQAVFEGDGQLLTLSGGAEVTEGDSLLRAETVTMRRGTGDATAVGGVRVSYRQEGSAEPVHVLAGRAEFGRAAGRAMFFGGGGGAGGGLARLWQGASQVEAPEIEFRERERTLVASAPGAGGVRTVLVSGGGKGSGGSKAEVVRVASRSLRYAEGERRAQFGGGVVLEEAGGTIRAAALVALLKPAGVGRDAEAGVSATGEVSTGGKGRGAGGSGVGLMGGGVERVTAEGSVEVTQPGRRATGERLVYTAADGVFVMTGTAGAAPTVVDEVQGSVTGSALQFHAGDNSVMVVGNAKGEAGRRVRTETQVRRQP